MKVELDEKSKMGRVRIVSDTQEEVDEFFSEINKIIKLTEDNINFYISSIQKQNLIEDISESEEDVIYKYDFYRNVFNKKYNNKIY